MGVLVVLSMCAGRVWEVQPERAVCVCWCLREKKKQKNSFPVHPASIQVIVHVLCVLRDP